MPILLFKRYSCQKCLTKGLFWLSNIKIEKTLKEKIISAVFNSKRPSD